MYWVINDFLIDDWLITLKIRYKRLHTHSYLFKHTFLVLLLLPEWELHILRSLGWTQGLELRIFTEIPKQIDKTWLYKNEKYTVLVDNPLLKSFVFSLYFSGSIQLLGQLHVGNMNHAGSHCLASRAVLFLKIGKVRNFPSNTN